ncbi:hypothetical protein NP493_1479g00033 [Ridgeia piscesae]|uniref:Protein kinase domain-containing protein n=1 Tax=Ridgeia piscesae TaxID=27915 RepID=A0AAD9NCG5_RIDPI|nr:hypothetical protein NP493_1479g00033 [Ridgeia piscesae]
MELGLYSVDTRTKLGQGSFGVVYKGRVTKTGAPVSVKQLEIRTDEHGARAMDEMKKYERLPAHPNLVKLLDFHYKNNAFWLCARGIAHMHRKEHHMLHRNLKPANIMLALQGDNLVIKLTDFGLAKDIDMTTTSQLKSIAGTPAFMAPEIYEKKPYTDAVDVFTLGLVFLGLLLHEKEDTYVVPSTETMSNLIPVAVQMITAKSSGGKQPVVISVTKSDTAKEQTVKSLISKMVVLEEDKRVSAQEVVDALKSIVESESIEAPTELKKAVTAKEEVAKEEPPAEDAVGGDGATHPQLRRERSHLEQILKDKVTEKAKRDDSGLADEMLQQLLVGIPLLRMMGLVRSEESTKDDAEKDGREVFKVGERVKIETDKKTAVELQEGHGGWVDGMEKYLGRVGVIKRQILHVFKVEFEDGQVLSYNPALLHKLDGSSAGSSPKQNVAQAKANSRFKGDDVVQISKDVDKVKRLQKGHGGWTGDMAKCIGLKGIVHRVDSDGDVYVECINQDKWTFNPDVLELVDTAAVAIRKGSLVLVIDDLEYVRDLQDDKHGGWNEAMRRVLGRAGTVSELLSIECVKVTFAERGWAMNTKALKHVATEGRTTHIIWCLI